jgi:hypothetical protein
MTEDEAYQTVYDFVQYFGQGFHPDTDFADYVKSDGTPSLSPEMAARFNASAAEAYAAIDAVSCIGHHYDVCEDYLREDREASD